MVSPRSFSSILLILLILVAIAVGIWLPKISFFHNISGAVRDENGTPVEGARIELTFAQSMFEGFGDKAPSYWEKAEAYSDKEGRFSFQWQGVHVYASATKPGYYSDEASRAAQGKGTGSPLLLLLRKVGDRQNLMRNEIQSKPVPIAGHVVEIHLAKPELVAEGQGHLRLMAVVGNNRGRQGQNYDWSCHLSVAGGGLSERTDKFQFEAPIAGYKSTIELRSMASTSLEWRDGFEKDFFVKLRDGTFARMRIVFRTDSARARVSCISWWNQSGSTNLEAGPTEFGDLNQN